jgi:hypothetical protein
MPNPPIRLRDVPDNAVLIFECSHCRHRATVLPVSLSRLPVPVPMTATLREIAARGRCQNCRVRSDSHWVTYAVGR